MVILSCESLFESCYINPYEWYYDHATIFGLKYIYIQEFMYHQTELNIAKMSWLTMNMAPLAIFQMAIDRPQTKWKKIQQKHRRMHGFSSYGVAEG